MRKYLVAAFALALFAADSQACGRLGSRLRHPFRGRFARQSTVVSYSETTTFRDPVVVVPECPVPAKPQ